MSVGVAAGGAAAVDDGPAASELRVGVDVDCDGGSVLALVANDGDAAVVVDVAVPLVALERDVEVGAGAVEPVAFDLGTVAEGDTEVRVSDAATGATLARAEVTIDCATPARPEATATLDCERDVVDVALSNRGGEPVAVAVAVEQRGEVGTADLAGDEVVVLSVPIEGADRVPIRVVTSDGTDVLRQSVDVDCPAGSVDPPTEPTPPAVTASPAGLGLEIVPVCEEGRADVTIDHWGTGQERFVVIVDDTVAGRVVVDGVDRVTLPVMVPRDEVAVTLARSGGAVGIAAGVIDCRDAASRWGVIVTVAVLVAAGVGIAVWRRRRSTKPPAEPSAPVPN